MIGKSHAEQMRNYFADQFMLEGDRLVYRKGMKGPPVRVTEAERDGFVTRFVSRMRYAFWLLIPATVMLCVLLVLFLPEGNGAMDSLLVYGGVAAILAAYLAVFLWAWNAPARELSRRPFEGAALGADEVRDLTFSRISYGQLVLAVPIAAFLLLRASGETDVLHGRGVFWLVLAGGLILAAGIQAFRKWAHERSRR